MLTLIDFLTCNISYGQFLLTLNLKLPSVVIVFSVARVGYANQAASCNAPVRVSFVAGGAGEEGSPGERIAFNYGRELFVYPYRGVRKAADLTKPIDKRFVVISCPVLWCSVYGAGCTRELVPHATTSDPRAVCAARNQR